MTDVKTRLNHILQQIQSEQQQAGRPANAVQLLAVSKTWPADTLRLAADAGQRLFGENYLQEALEKIQALSDLDLQWHFIGPIQSNKTRDIASHFDWVQSVDRAKIARRLHEQRPATMAPLNICLQVNIDNEATKSGVSPDDLMALAEQVSQFDRLCLRGLMVIPTATEDEQQQRDAFQRAHQLFMQLKTNYPSVDTLSMGMSADMRAAITEGSTMVRVGTAIFGKRNKQPA